MKNKVTVDLAGVVLWIGVIFTISSFPGDVLISIQSKPKSLFLQRLISDPVMHFLEYAVLAFLLVRLCSNLSAGIPGLFYVVGAGIFISLCDEFYQSRFAGRAFEAKDLLIDASGITAVVLIILVRK